MNGDALASAGWTVEHLVAAEARSAGWTFEQLVAAEAGFDDVDAFPDEDCDAEAMFAMQSDLLHDVLPAITRVAA